MSKKIIILLITNVFLFIVFNIIYRLSNIKSTYDIWDKFYKKYSNPPFKYIENILSFSLDYYFTKIFNFEQKLNYLIKYATYNIDDYDEEYKTNLTNWNFSSTEITTSIKTDDYIYPSAIDEINIIEDYIEDGKLNIISMLENSLDTNKIVVLFLFFVDQIQIFQNLQQKFDLNKVYLLGKNKTNLNNLEFVYEELFNSWNIQEIIKLSLEFIESHKILGLYDEKNLKNEKITNSELKMIYLISNLKNCITSTCDDNINDYVLSYFLNIFERTLRSINFLIMSDSLYKKGFRQYSQDSIIFKIGFFAFLAFVNLLIVINYEDDNRQRINTKKYKFK